MRWLLLLIATSGCSLLSSTDDNLDPRGGDAAPDARADAGDGARDGDARVVDGDAEVSDAEVVPDGDVVPDADVVCEPACDDGDPCTADVCAGECTYTPVDGDGDGSPAVRVRATSCEGGTDCDDANPAVYPFAAEACNDIDDDCDGRRDEDCMSPGGDSCAAPLGIELVGGVARVEGTLGAYADDHATICPSSSDVGRTGPDAVYFIPVLTTSDILIDTLGSEADTVLAVGTTCSTRGFELGCNQDTVAGAGVSRVFVHRYTPGGTRGSGIFVLVDGANGAETGGFVLNVRVIAPAADTCGTPLDISGGGSVVGFIRSDSTTYRGSCQSFGDSIRSEAVLTFVAPDDGDARFRVFSNDFRPDVYVRDACGATEDIDCVTGSGGGSPYSGRAELDIGLVPGASNTLFVDGALPGLSDAHYLILYDP